MLWNTFGPISGAVKTIFCPNWDDATLALLGNWGNIMYIVPVIPVMYYFQTKGLRNAVVMTAGLMVIGSLLRCLPFKVTAFAWACHACAILNGVAGIVIFSAPSAVSAAWFPPNERTTATGIAIVFNNLGNALSFLVGPAIVPDPVELNYDESVNKSVEPCIVIPGKELTAIQWDLTELMYLEFGLVAICFIAILFYFPDKPKLPPSLSSEAPRMKFVPGLKKICS